MKIGLFEGRHEMPVDTYFFKAGETNEYGFHQGLYDEAYRRGKELNADGQIEFYITGLTVAAVGCLDGMRTHTVDIILMNYDAPSATYTPIELAWCI